jgi:hypothetical protein
MTDRREALYVLTFGLSLVLAMATVLFALVGLNPKGDAYGVLPWVYSGACLVGGAICWRLSGRLAGRSTALHITTTTKRDD